MSFETIGSGKGISPSLTTLLLVVVAVAVVAVTWYWIMPWTGITATEEGKQIHAANFKVAGSSKMRIGISADLQLGLWL